MKEEKGKKSKEVMKETYIEEEGTMRLEKEECESGVDMVEGGRRQGGKMKGDT